MKELSNNTSSKWKHCLSKHKQVIFTDTRIQSIRRKGKPNKLHYVHISTFMCRLRGSVDVRNGFVAETTYIRFESIVERNGLK